MRTALPPLSHRALTEFTGGRAGTTKRVTAVDHAFIELLTIPDTQEAALAAVDRIEAARSPPRMAALACRCRHRRPARPSTLTSSIHQFPASQRHRSRLKDGGADEGTLQPHPDV